MRRPHIARVTPA